MHLLTYLLTYLLGLHVSSVSYEIIDSDDRVFTALQRQSYERILFASMHRV